MFLYPTTGKYKSTNVRVFLCIFSVEAGRQHQRQRGVITPFLILKPVGQDETFSWCQFKPTCHGRVATCGHVTRKVPPEISKGANILEGDRGYRLFANGANLWPGIPPTACHVRPCKNRPNRRKSTWMTTVASALPHQHAPSAASTAPALAKP